MIRVKKLDDSTSSNWENGASLDHWEKQTGIIAFFCAVEFCVEIDIVGARVQLVNSSDTSTYIVPLCKSHCNCGAELSVADLLVEDSILEPEVC